MERKTGIGVVRIAYLHLVGIFLIYKQWFSESPSYLGKESPIFRDKYVFPYQRLILHYQRLSFPYLGLSLRGVRDSEAGKFTDNIVFADFPLLGAYS